jgi:hypothetical protein
MKERKKKEKLFIGERKGEVIFFCSVPDTTRDLLINEELNDRSNTYIPFTLEG